MKIICVLLISLFSINMHAEPLFDFYDNNNELDSFIESVDSPFVEKTVLANTPSQNKIHLLKLSASKETKPAILILGDTNPASPVGSKILTEWLKLLLENKEAMKGLLETNSIYIIPRPFPDSTDKFFQNPKFINKSNNTPVDSDSDLEIDEDGPEDLNKDGFITLMRIKDEEGDYYQHPDSEFLMTKDKNKDSPSYKVFSEGIDNDKDELFNEDSQGGVNPNKNFSFAYPYFQKDAGVHQFSELESKAIVDFAFEHPEIFLIFSFGDEDNLHKPWKEDPNKKKATIRETIYKEDESLFSEYSKIYNQTFSIKTPASTKFNHQGSFSRWAYYHFGRISLSTSPWILPVEEIEGKMSTALKEIKWLEQNRPQAFVKWQKYQHPDFPGKDLEIGGIKPFYKLIPDQKTCLDRAKKFNSFISQSLKLKANILIKEFKEEKLNNQLSRLTLKIANEGLAPSRPEIGMRSMKMYPLNIELKLPKKWSLYKGDLKGQVSKLDVNSSTEREWLILTNNVEGTAKITIKSPHISPVTASSGDAQ